MDKPRHPITPVQAVLILTYVAIVVARQARHDARNIIRWASR